MFADGICVFCPSIRWLQRILNVCTVDIPNSNYESPFPTRDCILFVRSGLYELVIRVTGIRVRAPLRSCSNLGFALLSKFSAWTPRFQWVEFMLSLAHGPTWLFLLSCYRKAISAAANQKSFVNKDCAPGNLWNELSKWWEPNALLRLHNLKCQAVLVGS